MLDYAYGHDAVVADFVARMIPECRERGFGKCKAIGVVEGEELIAGLVYHTFSPEGGVIEVSAAALPGRNWFSRETIKRMHQYPFHDCGCQMMLARTSEHNHVVQRVLAGLEYAFIRIPRLLGRNEDAIVCLLTYEDWVDSKICKRFKHHLRDDFLEQKAA